MKKLKVSGRGSFTALKSWTQEEMQKFDEGSARFGDGSWSAIAAFIGTKSYQQVTRYASQRRKKELIRNLTSDQDDS